MTTTTPAARVSGTIQPDPEQKLLEETSLRARIGDISNQIHNLACRHQNDEDLSVNLGELSSQLWELARIAPDPEPQPVEIPRHPTEVMIDAGLYHMPSDVSWSDMFTAWTAMFDAVLLDGGATDYAPATPFTAGTVSVEAAKEALEAYEEAIRDFIASEWPGSAFMPSGLSEAINAGRAALRTLAGEGEQ